MNKVVYDAEDFEGMDQSIMNASSNQNLRNQVQVIPSVFPVPEQLKQFTDDQQGWTKALKYYDKNPTDFLRFAKAVGKEQKGAQLLNKLYNSGQFTPITGNRQFMRENLLPTLMKDKEYGDRYRIGPEDRQRFKQKIGQTFNFTRNQKGFQKALQRASDNLNIQVRQRQDQMEKWRKNVNILTLFPQWVGTKNRAGQKLKEMNAFIISKSALGQPQEKLQKLPFKQIYKVQNGKLIKDPQHQKAWNRIDSSIKTMANNSRQVEQSRWLANTTVSMDQINDQVPLMVKQIMQTNSQISKYGIGPISPTSLALYAGRWVDPVTNRIRIMPVATNQYLNPLSFNQKIAFHKARILNLWNNMVMQQQNIIDMNNMGPTQWLQRQRRSIQKSLLITEDLKENVKNIVQLYTDRRLIPALGGPTPIQKILFDQLTDQQDFYRIVNDKQLDSSQILFYLRQYWLLNILAVQQAYANDKQAPTPDYVNLMTSLRSCVLSLTSAYLKKIKSTAAKLVRIATAGTTMQEKQKMKEKFLVMNQIIEKASQQMGPQQSMQMVNDIGDRFSSIQSPQQLKKLVDQVELKVAKNISQQPRDTSVQLRPGMKAAAKFIAQNKILGKINKMYRRSGKAYGDPITFPYDKAGYIDMTGKRGSQLDYYLSQSDLQIKDRPKVRPGFTKKLLNQGGGGKIQIKMNQAS